MTDQWLITFKPSFQSEWLALPAGEVRQVLQKISLLTQDPLPDAKVKKRLKYVGRDLCRLRVGDYRIFYTYEKPYVSLLALRRRRDDTYDDETLEAEFLGGLGTEQPPSGTGRPGGSLDLLESKKGPKRPLTRPIDQAFLRSLLVPTEYHRPLLAVKDEEGLLACAGVPDDVLLRLHEALFERKAPEILEEREYVVQQPDDLLRFKEGELLGFLLRLDAEQEKYVTWAVNASGPTLVKGAPGTGKTTVAMYRLRAMLASLRGKGVDRPRLLFTTYTNALVAFSEQLLRSLLGPDADLVEVRTADSLAMAIVTQNGGVHGVVTTSELRSLVQDACDAAQFSGNSLQKRAQAQTIAKLGPDYVLEEICGVIDARRIAHVEGYLAAQRPGRRVALSDTQRRAVWAVRTALQEALDRQRRTTWQRLRAHAVELVEASRGPEPYDAVVVDEVQDIDPSLIQLFVRLCKSPGRLFLTADANQSIYGSGFRWTDIHESLRFRGRTGVLKVNHRSTAEIGEAATSYLADGALEPHEQARKYTNSGPLPVLRRVTSVAQEAALLARFFPRAAREFHLGIGACAVLVPTERAGKRIAEELQRQKVDACFMTGKELDLSAKCVKVLTLKSSKGLEFPVVALAGFLDMPWPPLRPEMTQEERAERLAQERRTAFVAMTRAMRALLVVGPDPVKAPLLDGFDSALWNMETT